LYRYFYYINHVYISITKNSFEFNYSPIKASKILKIEDIIKIDVIEKNNYTMYIIVNDIYKPIKITTRFVKSNRKDELIEEMNKLKKFTAEVNWHKEVLV